MESFFEDEEPIFEEFMRYPPFNTLMKDDFTIPKMIELYRDGNIILLDFEKIVDYGKMEKRHDNVNFFTKQREDTLFKIVNFDAFKFDEIDPIIIDDLHAVLMKVEWNDYQTQAPAENLGEIRQTQFLNLTPSEESTLSTFFSKVMRPNLISKYQDDDGKQVFLAQYLPREYNLYTTPYLKIYQPVNTEFPSWLEKALAKLFDEAKV
jgi:predicted ribosome quality control (RQC) complex YloA/Tae2 family protein